MKAITEYTVQEAADQSVKCKELLKKVEDTTRSDWFEDFRQQSGYAHYKFSGRVSDKLVELLGHEPTGDELIMLVDSGYSHFGASCSVSNRNFSGRVNTD